MKLPVYCAVTLQLLAITLNASDDSILLSLNEDMVQTAQIATRTNQNIDYQPFILSVWEQKDLFSFGVRTLQEALLLVPGIDMTADNVNNRTMIVRGSNPLGYGQTKLVIDGIVINDPTFDSYNGYLDFPIELIKRIEIVRGSGSFIKGVNGYSGTINVITFAHDTLGNGSANGSVFAGAGSDSARQIGFWKTYYRENWKLSADGFYQTDNAVSPISVTDRYTQTGRVPLRNDHLNAGVSLNHGNFNLKGRINAYEYGSAFGNFCAIPNSGGKLSNPSWHIESGYETHLSRDLSVKIKAGLSQSNWKSDERSIPPGGTYGGNTYPQGLWDIMGSENRLAYTALSSVYTGVKNHRISAGYKFEYSHLSDVTTTMTEQIDGGTQIVDYSNVYPVLNAGSAKRHLNELYLSDTIDINDNLALALNIGSIQASHLSTNLYKRAALVYQPSHKHVFKVMAGDSYRLPSWQEMYSQNNPMRIGNPALLPEYVVSYEAQYLYKPKPATSLGINIFYLENKDQIAIAGNKPVFDNLGQRNVTGFETEFRGSIGDNDLIALSYSRIKGESISYQHLGYLPLTSSHLLKGAFSYALSPQVKASITGRHTSEKRRRANDPRTNLLDSFTQVDAAIGWENKTGLYLQGGVKNIGNSIYRHPSLPSTYPDDYPVSGRSLYLRAGWKF